MIAKALWGVIEGGPPQPKPAPPSPRDPNYDPPTPAHGAAGRAKHGHESRKDWAGWVSPGGNLEAMRKGSWHYGLRGWLWVFRCLHCGGESERLPARLMSKPYIRSCGCKRRDGIRAAMAKRLEARAAEAGKTSKT